MGGTQNNNQPQANPPSLLVQVPSGSTAPRRSGRARQPTSRPNDVYEGLDPVECDLLDQRSWRNLMGGNPGPSQQAPPVAPVPLQQDEDEDQAGPSSWGNPPSPPDVDYVHHLSPTYSYTGQKLLADMCQEGGAPFINFLLAKAISPDDERDKSLPATSRVREWHF